ncbi:MAG: hypothetical protein OXB94_09320 [Nitrospira sp.]|nr:hypothetical protein [Nitrospira sp.]
MKQEVKRPRDANQLAKFVVDVATGEREASQEVNPVNTFAQAGGLKGGKARADRLSPERRQEIAKQAAQARWGRKK